MAKSKTVKKSRKQIVVLILLLLLLMTTSVVTSLMAVGIIDLFPDEGKSVNSMTDAYIVCNDAIKSEHGEQVRSVMMDDFSSRFDEVSGRYKMFFEVDMFREKQNQAGINKFFVNCFVSPNGRIRALDLFEEKPYIPKAGKRTTGNAFGL